MPKVDPKARVFYANTDTQASAWEHPLQASRRDAFAQPLLKFDHFNELLPITEKFH